MKAPKLASESVTRPSISQPPSTLDTFLDRSFRGLTYACAWLTILLMVYLLWRVGRQAAPAVEKYGLHFLTSTTWDVNKGQFGVLPEIWGTLYSSLLALILGGFFGVAIAILVVLENNNEHFTRLSAEGLSLFHALLSPRQEVMLGSCQEVGPGEPGSAAVQSVRPSAW